MKLNLPGIAALGLLVSLGFIFSEPSSASETTVTKIVSVYDGDTFRADLSAPFVGRQLNVPIRVRHVDTPEIKGKCQAEKQQAKAARDYAKRLLINADRIELKKLDTDRYNRVLAEVVIDGRRLDALLIGANLARPYQGGKRQGWCGFIQ